MKRRLGAALGLLLVAVALAQGARPSGADFVATSANPVNAFATAPVFNTVTASLSDPGTPLRGGVALAATAGSDHPLVSVRIQRSPAGAETWTDECTDTAAPYACSWDSTNVADGLYDLRAMALDDHGYSQTSAAIADRRVDNTGPSTAMTDPGTPLTGSETLNAPSTDPGSGVASVLMEYRTSPSGAWTELCTVASAPSSCDWSTTGVADGLYDLRSTATDAAGNSTTSAVVSDRRVDNTAPAVTVTDPGAAVRGTITLQSTTDDGTGTGVNQALYEYRATGSGGAWSPACSGLADPFSCSFNTTALTDGLYDLRATATDGAALSTISASVTSRRVDNTIPSAATMINPTPILSGNVALNGSGADAGSGIAALRFEVRVATTGTWATACTDSVAPFASCTWASTSVADGAYDFRVVAVDAAGNERASAIRTNRNVDNNGPTTVLADPGSHLRQTKTLTATATDLSGVQSVAFQYAPAGSGTWTTICTDLTSAYSCAWNTTGVADGAYDLRALGTDTLGKQSASTVLAGRIVDNSSPAAVDVQVNRAGSADRIDTDAVVFTYSQAMLPGSILAGWSGASTAISVRVIDNGATDTMDFYNAAGTARLNLTASASGLQLNGNHVGAAGAVFNANMVRAGAAVTVTLTGVRSGASLGGDKPEVALGWTPSTAATNAGGVACLPIAVSESGAADEDF